MKITYLDQEEFLDLGEEIYHEEILGSGSEKARNYQAFLKGWDSKL